MRKRIAAGLLALATGVTGLGNFALSQPPKEVEKANPPKLVYGHDLPIRAAGSSEVSAKTARFGVDVFSDETTASTIAISQVGSIAVTKGEPLGADKGRGWVAAYDLAVRKADEPEFTQKTKKWGVELFKFPGSNRLIYASEKGDIAFAAIPPALADNKGWKRGHGLNLKVREPGQVEFTSAKKFGIEVYLDQNTNGLVYVSETGSIAATPGKLLEEGKKPIAPIARYGLELAVRKPDEASFSPKTKVYAVEAFEDPNTGVLIYISQSGAIATAPNKALPDKAEQPTLVKGINLRARKAGEEDIEKAAKFGVEVFRDNRTGYLVFITDTGAISILPK